MQSPAGTQPLGQRPGDSLARRSDIFVPRAADPEGSDCANGSADAVKVLILYSLSPDDCDPGRFAYEFDMTAAVEGIAHALPDSIVAGVRGELSEVIAAVERYTPDVVFNLCEAPLGRPDLEHHVAAVLEWIGVPFTGSGSETLALCRRKDRTNAVLSA